MRVARHFNILLFLSIFLSACSTIGPADRYPAAEKLPDDCFQLVDDILGLRYERSKANFHKALSKSYSEEEQEVIHNNIDALLFIDHEHALPQLLSIYSSDSSSLTNASIYTRYTQNSDVNLPFRNFLQTTEFLFEKKPQISVDTLKQLHARLMAGGVDGVSPNALGEIRGEAIIGSVPSVAPINAKVYGELKANPYISVRDLKFIGRNRYIGHIGYPRADLFTPEVGKIIGKKDPELFKEITAIAKQSEKEPTSYDSPEFYSATKRMISILTDDLFTWFEEEMTNIGRVRNISSFKKFVKIVTLFQRHLISIHPFVDGNGRTIRQFALYYPFWRQGLPAPRLMNPNSDLYQPLDDWMDQIIGGVENSHHLYLDLTQRIKNDLPLGTSPELLIPRIPHRALIDLRKEAHKKLDEDYKLVDIDSSQFAYFFLQKMKNDHSAYTSYLKEPEIEIKKVINEYRDFFKHANIVYDRKKTGREFLALEFADISFMDSFANKSYLDVDKWQFKMDRWYENIIQWRGLASKSKERSEEDILGMFKNLDKNLVSNNVARNIFSHTNPDHIKALVMKEFKKYNYDLQFGGLAEMATHHSETGPKYGMSYGYSTSAKRAVGKAFAMGAMVVAEYGKQQRFQHLLKSRLLVGMRKAGKDVDLSRLKQMRPQFSYPYPRRKEIMGIAAADPDSIMFIQMIDEKGEVTLSYVRHPKKPNEIWVYKKEVSEVGDKMPPPDRKVVLND